MSVLNGTDGHGLDGATLVEITPAALRQYVEEASRDQAEAIYQSLLREAQAQATPEEAAAIDRLDALPRREALQRLTTDLWPGHASPVPADLAAALAETMRSLDPQTYGDGPVGRTIDLTQS